MALLCPRCKDVSLEELDFEEVVIDRCPRCAGLWFDNDEIGELVGRSPELRQLETVIPSANAQVTSMRCPRDPEVPLRELAFSGREGRSSLVHRCASCAGTWVDRGQLKVQEDPSLADALKDYFADVTPR